MEGDGKLDLDEKRSRRKQCIQASSSSKVVAAATSLDEDEKPGPTESDAKSLISGHGGSVSRRYRGTNSDDRTSLKESTITDVDERGPSESNYRDGSGRQDNYNSRSSQGSHPRSTPHRYDKYDDRESHDKHGERERFASVGYSSSGRRGYYNGRESHSRRDEHERSTSIDYTNKRSRHEHSSRNSRTPARSDWDSGRWEWEDTPRREYHDDRSNSRRQHPTPSPMLAAASPDARLVSPWLGGNTPRYTASPWDHVSPSPAPIRASGSSKGTWKLMETLQLLMGIMITEEMMHEMDYNADRAWYDCEEHNTMFDGDNSMYHGDDSSYKKREAQLPKRL
ncbi:hypothetical protein GUJ93_ZPchr0290g2811, partial [Zizania palustris]